MLLEGVVKAEVVETESKMAAATVLKLIVAMVAKSPDLRLSTFAQIYYFEVEELISSGAKPQWSQNRK